MSSFPAEDYIIIFVIVLIVARRLYSGVNGTKFSLFRVFRLPVLYIALTVILILTSAVTKFFYYMLSVSIALFFILFVVGLIYSKDMEFFEKEEKLYYKRKPYIMIIWMVTFLARIILEIAASNLIYAIYTVNVLMALSTGLITGEAINTYKSHKNYIEGIKKSKVKQ